MDKWIEVAAEQGHRYTFKVKMSQGQARQPRCSCGWRSRFYKGTMIREAFVAWREHVEESVVPYVSGTLHFGPEFDASEGW